MKKGVSFVILLSFLLVVLSAGSVLAQDEDITDLDEDDRIDLAYQCLEYQIGNLTDDDDDEITEDDCLKMTPEEMAFTVIATGHCLDELIDESRNDGLCWPKSNCDVKTTAQAIWALESENEDVEKAKDWLLDQKSVPREMVWYLQIDTQNESLCEITYQSKTYSTEILEDKTVASGAGSCLAVSENGYWLKIDPACYDERFEITCEKSSITNLLFREEDSSTIHVLDKIESTVDGGTTIQEIESYCFLGSNGCSYDGSLWATMVLDILDEEVFSYIPYLITGKESNINSFPLPFLYLLTGYDEYETEILQRQINDEYWQFENGRYFDSALALLPFQNSDLTEKENTIEWLLDTQQEDGCWEGGNIRNNAFVLYSLWPRGHTAGGSTDTDDDDDDTSDNANDCEAKGFYCMSGISCEGNILSEYSCFAPSKCCDSLPAPDLCSDYSGGVICNSNQYCSGGSTRTTDDATGGASCCVDGICKDYAEPEPTPTDPTEEYTCVDNGGKCETFSCGKGFTESISYTCSGDQTCCIPEEGKSSYAWVWILFFLIVLIVVGIIYRDKLKEILENLQKEKGKDGPKEAQRRGPGFPGRPGMTRPGMSRPGMVRPGMQRPGMVKPGVRPQPGKPILRTPAQPTKPGMVRPGMSRPGAQPRPRIQPRPSAQNPQAPAKKPAKSPQELDDVLKKLKEMSK